MSFAMPSAVAPTANTSRPTTDDGRQFCMEIADGLHALAQPLTILRSAIEMIGVCRRSGSDMGRYVELSTEHIQRACELFDSIQGLMITQIEPAKSEVLD